jgi:signal transduction histidine kinase
VKLRWLNILIIILLSCKQKDKNINHYSAIDALNEKLFNCNYENCNQYFDSVFYLLSNINYPKGLSDAYARKGLYYENNGKFDSAYQYYLLSTDIRKKIGDKKLIAFGFTNLAETVQDLKNWELCKQYLDTAWQLFHEVKDTTYLMKINQQFGKYYAEQNSFDKALPYFKNGLNYASRVNDSGALSMFYQSLGNVYGSLKKYDTSIIYFNQWKSLIDTTNYTEMYEYSCCISANYIENKNLILAKNEISNAQKYFNQSGLDSVEYTYLLAREYELAQAEGNYKNAFNLIKNYNELNNQYFENESARSIADMEVKYKTSEKETQNKILIAEHSQKNWILFSLVAGIGLLILIGFILYKYFRTKQKIAKKEIELKATEIEELLKTQELNNLNAMLKGQLEERQRIAKDLHDSLGSTLSTIKLMIGNLPITKNNMETQSLQTANTLIDEACKDVRKIAHNLYLVTHEEANFIAEIKKRLKTVALNQAIKTTFIDNQIDLSAYPHIQKDLFLITQELISNTLKYAQATEINIQLNIVDQELSFTYDDSGKGFNTQNLEIAEGMGYKSLDERIKKHQGTWHLDSTLGHGMTLIINIPLT